MFYFKEEEEKEEEEEEKNTEEKKEDEDKEEDEGMATNWPSDAVSDHPLKYDSFDPPGM
jgi:hypothetical protein